MFKKFTNGCVAVVQKFLPDPFLFAVILTFIVFILGIFSTGQSPMDMIIHWYTGFWKLLSFSMQMVLILVTGFAMAKAPIFKKGLESIANIPKSPGAAILIVSFISIIACWVNWGFGLVIGALLAKEVAKKVKGVDYRLLIASAYSGFLVWHAGLSGSIPLKLATGGPDLATATNQAITEAIGTANTIFSPLNIVILIIILVTMPFINRAMHPGKEETITIDPSLLQEEEAATIELSTPADKMENSFIITLLLSVMGFVYIIHYFIQKGFSLNLNIVNFIFLFVGIALHKTPKNYINAVKEAVKGSAGIVLQFPFYAGIMGMMVGKNIDGVSLAGAISNAFVSISNETTFPLFTFLSAGIVNFFVPSGGGQWAVQAPIMMPAGAEIGVPAAKTAMAIAWGDAWTNMIQPFWALPALGIAGLGARDIMGYCVVNLLYSGVIICTMMLIL
ncbi:short-chain fatty acid transporter [Paramaledivibacter caminithermalis]|uniref:Short-chain fatty acids transporter n=1 Tax=Paramaledivibacter caminithermalis (strain DSM 15212 / CIP 107654 / DViRD3) TaxID=1121301 RepID=A0A1M6Q3B1_PARC5|nr:short-chain fatty acid transporter [Paramaledivibacter caminithermalis]SHK14597.1 short-chain fatty acids transporter [Paramaledivibacter caminithermalis DSM 15212]